MRIDQTVALLAMPMRRKLLSTIIAVTLAMSITPNITYAAPIDLHTATIADLNAAFKAGTLTSEKLTQAYLARIDAYEKKGPKINSIIYLNPKALEQAKALDAERKAGKIRGPLHGIPIVLKDNFDTIDMQTTGGSQMLAGSIPPDDAFVVKKLRDAGAIILAKMNLSEFAGGGSVSGATDPAVLKAGTVPNGSSSMGGQTLNPHNLTRGPAGSIRGPSSVNGIVGLKPTHGLLSRDGIVPLALSFDTGGPMARSVYDIAVALNVMTGVDPADAATQKSVGKVAKDYTAVLKTGSLKGARIGVARDFTGKNPEVDAVFNAAVAQLTKQGATVVDFNYPAAMLDGRMDIFVKILNAEFKAQIADYLKTTGPKYPKSLADLAKLANDPTFGYHSPEKAYGLKYTQSVALDLKDPAYLAAKNDGLKMITATVDEVIAKNKFDAIVYPTAPRAAALIKLTTPPVAAAPTDSATNIANMTGYPDLIVPAGMTKSGLPVTISFFGPAFSEAKLLGYGYDFEQATKAIRLPKFTPALPTDTL
jgi:amidase